MLVRYQLVDPRPRLTTSFQKSFTRKVADDVGVWRTYEMTFQPVLPDHTSQVAPATVAVPILEPMGWIGPVWFSQTMSSAPSFCCVVVLGRLLLNQMSYAAS